MDTEGEITRLLAGWRCGCAGSGQALFERLYPQLRRLASQRLARAACEPSVGATELVAEMYLRLVGQQDRVYLNRGHFLAIASHVARQILVDHARRKTRLKRGGRAVRSALPESPCDAGPSALEPEVVLSLHRALEGLKTIDDLSAKIVVLRFFGGLSIEQTAAALDVGRATVVRDWRWARAWLHRQLHHGAPGDGD